MRPTGKFDPEDYASYVQPVGIMKSVEQFWSIMVHFKRPTGKGFDSGKYLKINQKLCFKN